MAAENPSYVDAVLHAFGRGRLWPAPAGDELSVMRPGSRRLVVIVHQFGGDPKADLTSLAEAAGEALQIGRAHV